jgi:hypothetical protein
MYYKMTTYQYTLESLFSGKQVGVAAVGRCHVGPVEHHVDECDEDGGGAALGDVEGVGIRVGVVLGPLDEHEEGEVAEDGAEEDNLRNELRPDVEIFSIKYVAKCTTKLLNRHYKISARCYNVTFYQYCNKNSSSMKRVKCCLMSENEFS